MRAYYPLLSMWLFTGCALVQYRMEEPSEIDGTSWAEPDSDLLPLRARAFPVTLLDGRLDAIADGRVQVQTLGEPQGEGVALGPGGLLALTSEAGSFGGTQSLNLLRCSGAGS